LKEIRHIGIAGEGKMGSSLFLYLLGYDFRLSWLCSSGGGKEKAMKQAGKKLNVLLRSGVMTEQEYIFKTEGNTITDDPGDLKDCDLLIEAIPEDIAMKCAFFSLVDEIINPGCLFTTNSSSIVPSKLIPSEKRKETFAGMHFFFPVNMKKTVELVAGPETSPETISALSLFLTSIEKKAFYQDEKNAFILNRLFLDFQAEAYQICHEGKLTYRQVDSLVKERFFPAGVFEFFDHVGIDVMLASIRAYSENTRDKCYYAPLIEKMEELEKKNNLGLKTRRGFYEYCQPGSGNTAAGDPENLPESLLMAVERRLRDQIEGSVKRVLDSGAVISGELAEAVKDYLGIDDDLTSLQKHIQGRAGSQY
jgi:3-hydroxybutyryl-CoA dehydrogenase